jgi:hypothetical protein
MVPSMVDLYKKAKMAFLIATEPARVVSEILHLRKVMPKLMAIAPKGDGHPVLVIPGFMATDHPTILLRNFLDKLGYKTYGWENGANAGLTEDKINRLYAQLKKISDENGGKKVSIIGWSLGGIEAHVMAHEVPEIIRNVITLGSPFGINEHPDASPKILVSGIQVLNEDKYTLKAPGMPERMLTPAPGVPTTSIYSKTDGIAGWRACLNPTSPLSENIEVEDASHIGFVFNPRVFAIIADRLAQREGHWKPYDCPRCRPPENPKFELTEDNTFLKDLPLDARKKKPTSRNNSGHHHPEAPPS